MSGHARKIKGLTKVVSNNWSGYADTGSNYSTVTGSWTESSGQLHLDDVTGSLLGRN